MAHSVRKELPNRRDRRGDGHGLQKGPALRRGDGNIGVHAMRDDGLAASEQQSSIADSLLAMLNAFRGHDIRYCYWKSSRRIEAVLAGVSDVDLLVARDQQHEAYRLLLECGFKLFPATAGRFEPSIVSFLGHDDASGRLIHVHLHLGLMAGGKLHKNYRLPWEAAVLDHAVW